MGTADYLSNNGKGELLGVQVGVNHVMSSGLLIGAELSGSLGNIAGDSYGSSGLVDACPCSVDGAFHDSVKSLGIGQLKLGYANDQFALYVSGGVAVADVKTSFLLAGDGYDGLWNSGASWSDLRTGWTVGGGLDYALTQKMTIGVSYNYVNLGSKDFLSSTTLTDQGSGSAPYTPNTYEAIAAHSQKDLNLQIVKVSVDYHF
jgi:outer membrane immunogenic protein